MPQKISVALEKQNLDCKDISSIQKTELACKKYQRHLKKQFCL